MALKKCKECKKEISTNAKSCPNCGAKNAYRWGVGRVLTAIIIIFFALAIFIPMINNGSKVATVTGTNEDLPKRAFYKAQEYVKANLKAPSTAVFPYCDSASVKRVAGDERGAMYEVVSYVDSQNSFGAQLRTSYKCSIVRVHASSSWIMAEMKTW